MKYDIISIFLIRSMIFDLHCRSGQPLSTIVQSGLTFLSLAPESPGAHPDSTICIKLEKTIWLFPLIDLLMLVHLDETAFPCQ